MVKLFGFVICILYNKINLFFIRVINYNEK